MNVCENIIVGSQLFPEHEALIYGEHRVTYAQLERLSAQAARYLLEQGVERGDRIGIMLPNAPSFVVWYYATLRLGAIAVSVSTRFAPKEVAFILSDCEAKVLIAPVGDHVELKKELPGCTSIVLEVSNTADHVDSMQLDTREPLDNPSWLNTEPHEPAVILYTSGTTGFPKGATLSHQNIRATVHAFNHLCDMQSDDHMLLAVPLFHCFGQNALLNSALNVGATLVMQSRFDLNESKRLIREQRITKLFGVPTMFQLLEVCCELADLATVDYCFSAATTLPIQVSERWQKKFNMPIYEGYGLTETAPFASYNHRLKFVPGSIGTPVDLVEMKVIDTDTGENCPPGKLGEIVIRGPNVMLGYWNRPEETAEAVRDGWFHSGDIGRIDECGYFYIVDRVKDMISIGGMKVFPAEIERVLLDHPSISEAAVVGFPDPVFGEKVVAFLVSSQHEPDLLSIELHCQQHFADYKIPKHFIVVEELPRNPTGKILKKELRETEWPELDNTHCDSDAEATKYMSHNLIAKLEQEFPANRRSLLTSYLQDELKDIIGTDERPGAEEKLLDTGMDSLMIVELRDRLQLEVGEQLELPATLVFDYPRICDLAAYLESALVDDTPQPSTSVNEKQLVPSTANLEADIATMSEEEALAQLLRETES